MADGTRLEAAHDNRDVWMSNFDTSSYYNVGRHIPIITGLREMYHLQVTQLLQLVSVISGDPST